ncbi:MAG: response regulator [Nitrospiraceae bacterium]|nr:response regulator [Nitrospiraceae bacterium]
MLKGSSVRAKHVLVVDDDEAVRSLVSHMLSREGFQVTTATDGAEALALFVNGGNALDPVDLLLTDVNMAGLSGLELVDALKDKGMELPTLVMSGKGGKTLASEVESRGCLGLLRKPFYPSVLIGHVRQAINDSAPSAVVQE